MFKQLLTFALAGILVLETPATAYAAGQSMNAAVADDPAVSYETTAGEAGDVSNGVSDAEKSGGGYSGNDQSDQSEEGLVDETNDSGSDSGSSNEAGDTGNENGSTDETGDTGNGNGSSNETGDTGGGDGSSDETGDTGNGNGSSEETGDIGNGSGSSDETGDTGSGDDTSDEDSDGDSVADQPGGADGQDQTDGNGGGEDDSGLRDGLEGETVETVSANDLAEPKAAGMSARAGGVTEISYEEASNTGVEITAPSGSENSAQYLFTAPANGRYVFYTEAYGSASTYFQVYDELYDEVKYNGSFYSSSYLNVKTDYMEQGERLYIETYTTGSQGATYTLKVAGETSLVKAEDGSYSAAMPDGSVINISAREGYRHLQFEAQRTSGSGNYYIRPWYCPADHSSADSGNSYLSAGNWKSTLTYEAAPARRIRKR